MSETNNFGNISTRSIIKFCETARNDKAFLQTAIEGIRADIVGFVARNFSLTEGQTASLKEKFNEAEATEIFALTCIRALKHGRNINVRFVPAVPEKTPNFKITWRKCKPYPDPGQPEFEDCCGVCVDWECRENDMVIV